MDKKTKKNAGGKVKKVKNESSGAESADSGDEIVAVKPNKMSMFQLLNVEEPDNSGSDSSDDEPVQQKKQTSKNAKKAAGKKKNDDNDDDATINDDDVAPTKPQPGGKKVAAGKNTKAGKKKPEEDIDAILAELSITPNDSSSKKEVSKKEKKKGKKADEDEKEEKAVKNAEVENTVEKTTQLTVELNANMTQEEIAKAMEEMYADDSEDEKKKKKKAGKKAAAKPVANANKEEEQGDSDDEEDEVGEGGTVKSAAQKKREKKERQKQERMQKTKEKPGALAADKTDKTTKTSEKPASVTAATVTPTNQEKATAAAANQETATDVTSQSAIGKDSTANGSLATVAVIPEATAEAGNMETMAADEETGADGKKKSKKEKEKEKNKKKTEKEEKEKPSEKKPSKMVKQMQEELRLRKELEEKMKREEEERIKKEEEAIRLKEEKERLEQERKEREKLKKQERIKRQKAEGTYLTPKERESRRRAQQMLEAMKAQGVEVPQIGGAAEAVPDKPKKVVYDSRPKKKKQQQEGDVTMTQQESVEAETEEKPSEVELEKEESPDAVSQTEETTAAETVAEEEQEEDVKDAWDVSSEEEEEEEAESKAEETKSKTETTVVVKPEVGAVKKALPAPAKKEEEEESEDEDSEDEDETETESEEEDGKSNKEKSREKALARIQKRKEEAEAKRTPDNLRAPVVCVLGHVDTGKTKILDKLRRTNVQDGEAGGITQQIGATNVPQDTIKEQTKMCKEFTKKELKIPGLLIIDTPGHESFSNLRNRGSSLCDIAVLVVDIMHGLEPQTIESINLLKSKKTPFVVALNKIDRLFQWQTNPQSDVMNTIKKQKPNTKIEFDERAQAAIVQLAEQGLNAALFYENKNVREYVNVVPTSAHTGDGMGSLIAVICDLTQTMLYRQLMFSEELKATVMEVKALPGLGTTIDVILVSGELHEGETIVVAGQEGPIVTQIRALLLPQPLRELRVKSAYEHHKTVRAAQGCKIVAKDLERALAGLPLLVAKQPDEIEIYQEELSELLKEVLGSIKVAEKGVFVQASTLGSLEALLEFLKTSQIPFAGINIGPVHKRDITKASVMLERDEQYATILAFDVKVEREAQEMADSLGVRIFTADIIYHLFDKFTAYRDEYKKKKQEEFKHIAVFPCKLRILPQCIFKTRDPIVIGVNVEAGFLKEGTIICVPTKEFVDLGRVSSIEINHKPVERAVKGQEVCIKIEPIPGEAPKMFGRHFEASDMLVSKISRASIDAVKNYFRDELSKADWVLMVELKKTFDIL